MSMDAGSTAPLGPFGWVNWHAHASGKPELHSLEYVLYSDSMFLGELAEPPGPYRVLNLLSGLGVERTLKPQLALQTAIHVSPNTQRDEDVERNNPGSYHGGWIDDEFAAIFSLVLNTRVQSGGMWRSFNMLGSKDPRGIPHGFHFQPPVLPPPEYEGGRELIPNIARVGVSLEPVDDAIASYAALESTEAIAFIRAARQFQAALWVSENDPNLAWLFLVGALESLAVATAFGGDTSDATVLAASWPEMTAALAELGPDSREEITAMVAPQSRSTFKVASLVEQFAPDPPEDRARGQIDWDEIVPLVRKVYAHRSKALHEGIPIPFPMNESPYIEEDGRPFERPLGLSTHSYDASWPARQTPMYLWTFAYVVRGTMLNWLRDTARK